MADEQDSELTRVLRKKLAHFGGYKIGDVDLLTTALDLSERVDRLEARLQVQGDVVDRLAQRLSALGQEVGPAIAANRRYR